MKFSVLITVLISSCFASIESPESLAVSSSEQFANEYQDEQFANEYQDEESFDEFLPQFFQPPTQEELKEFTENHLQEFEKEQEMLASSEFNTDDFGEFTATSTGPNHFTQTDNQEEEEFGAGNGMDEEESDQSYSSPADAASFQAAVPVQPAPKPAPPKRKANPALFFGVIAGFLLVIGLGSIWFHRIKVNKLLAEEQQGEETGLISQSDKALNKV